MSACLAKTTGWRACLDAADAQVGCDKVLRALHAAQQQLIGAQRCARRGHNKHDIRVRWRAPGARAGRGSERAAGGCADNLHVGRRPDDLYHNIHGAGACNMHDKVSLLR